MTISTSIKCVHNTKGGSTFGQITCYLRDMGRDEMKIEYCVAAGYAHLYNLIYESEIVYTEKQVIDTLALYAAKDALIPGNDIEGSEYARARAVHQRVLAMIYGEARVGEMFCTATEAYNELGFYLHHITGSSDIQPCNRIEIEGHLALNTIAKVPGYLTYNCAYRRYRAMSVGAVKQKRKSGYKDYLIFDALQQEHEKIMHQKRDLMSDIELDTLARDAVLTVFNLLTREI